MPMARLRHETITGRDDLCVPAIQPRAVSSLQVLACVLRTASSDFLLQPVWNRHDLGGSCHQMAPGSPVVVILSLTSDPLRRLLLALSLVC